MQDCPAVNPDSDAVTHSRDETRPPTSRWKAVLTDVHFWVPLAALVAGVLVLRWVGRS